MSARLTSFIRLLFTACTGCGLQIAALHGALAAAVPSPSPSASPKMLDSIVVSAQRHPQKIRNTSRKTFLVAASDIERFGAQTVADALRFVTGTVVRQYGVTGSLSTVALRGASSAETLVLIDGRPANEADTGLFDFSSLPANAVERVEVVEGGSSTLYGSAALGGVINLITKQPRSGSASEAYAALGYQGAFDRGLSFSLGDARRFSARVDASSTASNSVFDYPAFVQLEPAGTRTNEDVTLKHTGVRLADFFGAVHAAFAFEDDAAAVGAPGSVAFASAFARQQRVYQRIALDVNAPVPGGDIGLQAYSDSKRLRFFDPSFQFDTHANGTTRGLSVRATQALGSLHVLTAGWDSRGDIALFDPGISGQAPSIVSDTTTAWYLQDELHRPQAPLSATIGLRSEHIAGTQSVTTPSLGVLERLNSRVALSANYARAFRAPSLNERYYPFYGNPLLQPEYGASFDAGVRAESAAGVATFSWFGSDTNNLIVNVPIDQFGNVAPYNVNRAKVRGVEGSLHTAIGGTTHLGIAYTDFIEAADFTPGKSKTRLQYRPSATGGISLWRQQHGWNYGLQGAFVGKRFADESNTKLMPPYFLSGAYVQRALGAHTSLTLRADNLGNNHHAEDVLGYPIIGTALSLRIAVHY